MRSPVLSNLPLRRTAIVFFLLLMTACASSTPNPDTIYQRVTEGKLKVGDAIPAPTGDVIVTVTGRIGTKNSGDSIQMDMPTIESVGLVDYKVTDPFEKRPTVFRGPLMSTLLD